MVHYQGRSYGELYDLRHDPWEKQNRWNDASCESIKVRLQSTLIDHLIAVRQRSDAEWNHGAPEI
jgi:uncharacterized sulfatase